MKDDLLGPQNIKVTDKEVGRWKESNPRDYAQWFKRIAKLMPVIIYADRILMEKYASAEPLPRPAFSRPLLNRIIQLLKRHRDMTFKGDKNAPISAIITTLTARSYEYHANSQFLSLGHFIKAVVNDIPRFITRTNGEESVPNPANGRENYADKWRTKPDRQAAFYKWHAAAILHFDRILSAPDGGKQQLFQNLSEAYGEAAVKKAVTSVGEARKLLTEDKKLGVSKGSGFIAPLVGGYVIGQTVLPVRAHTFDGD